RVPLLIALRQFAEAMKAVEGSRLEAALKGLWRVRIRLAELAGLPPGDDGQRIRAHLFRDVRALKEIKASESRLALVELARSGISPDPSEPPDAWDALADAYQAVGDLARAAVAAARAADGAAAAGQSAVAAGYRLRAGAFFFQAGQFPQADAALSRV